MHALETRETQVERENRNLASFQHDADTVAHLIVNTDLPWVDVAIEIDKLRRAALRLFPQKMELFEWIYARRFERLWQQWRDPASKFQ